MNTKDLKEEYPGYFLCPECGELHTNGFYSASVPSQNRLAYIRWVCPNKHEWFTDEDI